MPAYWLGRDRIRFTDFMAKVPRGATRLGAAMPVSSARSSTSAPIALSAAWMHSPRQPKASRCEEAFYTAVAPASVSCDAINEYYKTSRTMFRASPRPCAKNISRVNDRCVVLQVDDAVLANM